MREAQGVDLSGGSMSVTCVCLTVPKIRATLCVASNKIHPSYIVPVSSCDALRQHYSTSSTYSTLSCPLPFRLTGIYRRGGGFSVTFESWFF